MAALTHQEIECRTIHHSDGLWVLNKPHDLPTSGRSLGDPDCLQSHLIGVLGRMVWAVHQLDADTSGLNLFVTQKHLVQKHKLRMAWPNARKSYLAVLHGSPSWPQRHIEQPLGRLPGSQPPSLGVLPSGRYASSRFEVLARSAKHCLVRVQIETGRTHQIRIHAAHLGHPLVGEEWYREEPCKLHPRQALHAHRIHFSDSDQPQSLEAGLASDFIELCASLGLKIPTESVSVTGQENLG